MKKQMSIMIAFLTVGLVGAPQFLLAKPAGHGGGARAAHPAAVHNANGPKKGGEIPRWTFTCFSRSRKW